MENNPSGLVEKKLDLKNSSRNFDGTNSPEGSGDFRIKPGKVSRIPVAVKRRNVENGKRNQASSTSKPTTSSGHLTLQRPSSTQIKRRQRSAAQASSCFKPPPGAKTTEDRTRAHSISGKNLSDKEESHRRLDKVNDAIAVGSAGDIIVLSGKVADSENNRDRTDAAIDVVLFGDRTRKVSENFEVYDGKGAVEDHGETIVKKNKYTVELTSRTFRKGPKISIKPTFYSRTEKIQRVDRPNMSSNEIISSGSCENTSQSQINAQEFSDGLKNSNQDFIQMLTLDAKEFLKIKCLCQANSATCESFCKDCFRNSRKSTEIVEEAPENNTNNNNHLSESNVDELTHHNTIPISEDNIVKQVEANGLCELKHSNNRLLNDVKLDHNDGKQKNYDDTADCSDKTDKMGENVCVNCTDKQAPVFSDQNFNSHSNNSHGDLLKLLLSGFIRNKDTQTGLEIPTDKLGYIKRSLLENKANSNSINDAANETIFHRLVEELAKLLLSAPEQISENHLATLMHSYSDEACKSCFAANAIDFGAKKEKSNSTKTLEDVNDSTGSETIFPKFIQIESTLAVETVENLDSRKNDNRFLSKQSEENSRDDTIQNLNKEPVFLNNSISLATERFRKHNGTGQSTVENVESNNEKNLTDTTSIKADRSVNNSIHQPAEIPSATTPSEGPEDFLLCSSCTRESPNKRPCNENTTQSSTEDNLDPKSALQHLVNPPGSLPNSSETFPSSSHRQQSSSYGESCAPRESIGTDGRRQEQAPRSSRESAADVVVSDAPGRRISQDPNPGAVSLLLTETPSDTCVSGPKESVDTTEVNSCVEAKGLTWEFKNGRLVFAESKSNLEESRLQQEQVVCAEDLSDKLENDQRLKPEVANSELPKSEEGSSSDNELGPPVSRTTARSTDGTDINLGLLSSKYINKRADDSNSRLKYLEHKLKEAGIIDAKNGVSTPNSKSSQEEVNCNFDSSDEQSAIPNNNNNNNNSSECAEISTDDNCACAQSKNSDFTKTHQYNNNPGDTTDQDNLEAKVIGYSEFQKEYADDNADGVPELDENEELIPDVSNGFCQFDVNDFSGFSAYGSDKPFGVYDDFIEESSSDESCECDDDDDEHFIVIRRMRGDGIAMVNDSSERSKHNPDRDNLKSLLKKPGRAKDRKSNRVVFNENKNEFFDADYIILIREDCDLDDDDDDGICTCQQHEMVRLTCCEPNCNCQFEDGIEQTPQSPKFAPPMEFVDTVTLSPPEGYKDMELMAAASRVPQRGAVCRECSATHEEQVEEEGEVSQSDSEMDGQHREQEEKEKTDQSQQTTPTTPPSSENLENQNYILETLTTTRITQQQILREAEEPKRNPPPNQGSPISGILKGGRLWKQQSGDAPHISKSGDMNFMPTDCIASDDESINRRSVRFIESEEKEKRDVCDGAPESSPEEEVPIHNSKDQLINESQLLTSNKQDLYSNASPDAPEMTLTFKLGNHVLISNNSLKPNSAVRQLFPCTKSLASAQGVPEEDKDNSQQYLVTAESLRAFEEAKRSKLPQIIQSGETDETIKRAIERNTLRRSLIRYEPRSKRQPYKSDNSLVERIKQLTCDVDDNNAVNADQTPQQSSIESSDPSEDVLDSRSSPPGEESRNSPDVNMLGANKAQDKSFSPSSSSTASSNSSASINQNYHQMRKLSNAGEQPLTVEIKRVDTMPDIQNNFRRDIKPLPDIGGPHNHDIPPEPPRAVVNPPDLSHCVVSNKISSSSNTSESRRQFLSTLAPLAACVTMGVAHNEDYYYHLSNSTQHNQPGERVSVASSGTEYSLEDIDEGLKTEDEEHKRITPDVLAGTPSASESGDELAMFVQQDAGRIERIKKKYQPAESQSKDNKTNDEDDEHDDYGFNRRPSVRGIKPRFSTTTEILQQIQNQLQPPAPPTTRAAWPYYSESGLTDNAKQKNANQNIPSSNYQYVNVGDEVKTRGYPPQYRPTSLQEETLYQNCANQRCVSRDIYQRSNANVYSSVIRMGNEYYQSMPLNRQRNGRPQSPPPMDMSKQYHQTMVYIPYNHIEGYQPVQYYQHTGTTEYVSRVATQNHVNKRYVEPVYQSRVHHHVDDHHYNPNMIPPVPPKTLNRVPYPNGQPPPHVMAGSRSESPLPGQFSTARATQTPAPTVATCGYYPSNTRYRPVVGPAWQGDGNYVTKVPNRHSFPSVGQRYPPADNISLTDSDSQHSGSLPNGYRQSDISMYASKDSMPNSPTKPRFIERGVPEGAASVSPQDASGISQSSSSTMTSPTSPQNPPVPTNQKAMFYAMNV